MARRKDKYGSIGVPVKTHREEQFKRGAYELRSRSPMYNFTYKVLGVLFISLIAFIIIGGFNGVVRLNKLTDQNAVQLKETYNPAFKVKYSEFGSSVVNSWFNNGLKNVGLASYITWPAGVEGAAANTSAAKVSGVTFISGQRYDMSFDRNSQISGHDETLNYLVNYNAKLYTASITLRVDDSNLSSVPTMISPPTLLPYVAPLVADTVNNQPEKLQKVDGEPSPNVQSQIDSWAKAWASDDRGQLKRITQDSNVDRTYSGLGGWQVTDASPVRTRWAYNETIDGKDVVIAQVQFDVQSLSDAAKAVDDKGQKIPQTVYKNTQYMDILIKDYKSGLPSIVSWGPAGSWSSLSPFSNGIDIKAGVVPPATSSPAPSITSKPIVEPIVPPVVTPPPAAPAS